MDIINRVDLFIREQALLNRGDRVLLSLSAGKDSMTMFHILNELREDLGIDIAMFHLNHLVRGYEADEDERFLKDLAERHGVPIFIERYDFMALKDYKKSFEEQAREVRYRFLEEIARVNGFDAIATAHTVSDSIETVLMRLFTGTGIHGLAGISPRRGNIIRPILCLTAEDAYGFIKERGYTWREDATNSESLYTRNYIRNQLVPLIRSRFKNFEEAVSGVIAASREAEWLIDYLIKEACGDFIEETDGRILIRAGLIARNRFLFNHILAKSIRDGFGHFVNRGMIDEIFRRFMTKKANNILYENERFIIKKLQLNGSAFVAITRSGGHLNTLWEYAVNTSSFPADCEVKELGLTIRIDTVDHAYFHMNKGRRDAVFICCDAHVDGIIIRNRRKGDRIELDCGSKKIKDFFIEKKLDKERKNSIPLVIVGNDIAAVMPGLLYNVDNRVSRSFIVREKSKKVLAITVKNQYNKDGYAECREKEELPE